MKKIVLSIFVVLLIGYGFAQEYSCWGVDKSISYLDNIVGDIFIEINKGIKSINTNSNINFNTTYLTTQDSFSTILQWISNNLENSYQNQQNNLQNNLQNYYQKIISYWWGLFYSFLTTLSEGISEPFSILATIFAPWEFVLDYKELMYYTDKIRNAIIKIWKKWYFFISLPKENQEKIISLFRDSNLLIRLHLKKDKSYTYGDILNIMLWWIYLNKKVILYASRNTKYSKINSFLNSLCEKKESNDKFCSMISKIRLDENKYIMLVSRYKICPDRKLKISQRFQQIVEIASWQSMKYTRRWNKALSKLDKALEWGIFDREKSIADIDTNINLNDLWKVIKSNLDSASESIKYLNQITDNKFYVADIEKDKVVKEKIGNLSSEVNKVNFRNQINNIFQQISNLEKNNFNDIVIQDVTITTRKYRLMSELIHKNIAIIWNKWDRWTIIDLLWQACEKQCSNVWGICWYF